MHVGLPVSMCLWGCPLEITISFIVWRWRGPHPDRFGLCELSILYFMKGCDGVAPAGSRVGICGRVVCEP